jgi:hypothetical protein
MKRTMLLKHRQQFLGNRIYDYFEDEHHTELLVFERGSDNEMKFIKRLTIPRKSPVDLAPPVDRPKISLIKEN